MRQVCVLFETSIGPQKERHVLARLQRADEQNELFREFEGLAKFLATVITNAVLRNDMASAGDYTNTLLRDTKRLDIASRILGKGNHDACPIESVTRPPLKCLVGSGVV